MTRPDAEIFGTRVVSRFWLLYVGNAAAVRRMVTGLVMAPNAAKTMILAMFSLRY
jgi:hypothetical protein